MITQTVERQNYLKTPPKQEISLKEIFRLALVKRLYVQFENATGKITSDREKLDRAYHPVLERAKVVTYWLEEGYDKQNISDLKQDVKDNIVTTLSEHFKVRGGTGYYDIRHNSLVSPRSPNEPFIESIKRGVLLRESLGSPDLDRETAEITGWEKITSKLISSPIGTRMISLSPPSQNNGPYSESVVDEFISVEYKDTKQVLRRRTMVDFTIEDYKIFAKLSQPGYFDNYNSTQPIDAYVLENPIESKIKIPENRIVGYPPEKFEKIIFAVEDLINKHRDTIFEENIDWRDTVETLNNLYWYAEKAKQEIDSFGTVLKVDLSRISFREINAIAQMTPILSKGGCGLTGGFEFGSNTFINNSVAQFGIENNSSDKACIHCPYCNKKVEVENGPGYIECKSCHRRKKV